MGIRRKSFSFGALLGGGLCLIPASIRAELVQFAIDQTRSALSISGTFAGFAIEPQETGSLMTRYTGTIEADVTNSGIQFVGGSIIAAMTNGNWEPAAGGAQGTAPANCGAEVVNLFVNGKAALREVRFDLTSDALTVNNGTFNAQGLSFNFVPAAGSVIDYSYSITFGGSGSGSTVLTGVSTNANPTNGTLMAQSNEFVLMIPVEISGTLTLLNPNDVQYLFRGQLVGRASASAPVRINSFWLNPGQLNFSIATISGQTYSILGSTNLVDWLEIVDQFTATNAVSERIVARPSSLPQQFFRVRRD